MTGAPQTASQPTMYPMTKSQTRYVSIVTDILTYTVVLNLFIERGFAIIESFTMSLFTAVVLKIILDIVLWLKARSKAFFGSREGAGYRIAGICVLAAILFLSKFVVLETIHLIFGDYVWLGGFFAVSVLIITLMIARLLLHLVYRRLGQRPTRLDPS